LTAALPERLATGLSPEPPEARKLVSTGLLAVAPSERKTVDVTAEKVGCLIGGVFGLIFVFVNTGSLPSGVALALWVGAVVALVAVLLAVRRPAAPGAGAPSAHFTRGYWLVVAGEVVALVAGLALINGPLAAPQAAVAWVSFVVGAHFVALALVWRLRLFHALGVALGGCGMLGLLLAQTGSSAPAIDVTAGVIPGVILLGFALWGSTRTRARTLLDLS
jgi:hypothetical protein